ncbi:hypothetical protein A4A49_39819 [Nicotiana attenuata]|uniref:Uncharacterized protein n=1 Tax=Nicotiana attenuata TaxID=49451 RepID=A0A314KJB5_NICAT|nr:hypothetical protein A4A49_39819 [Nicotiana attenuata]
MLLSENWSALVERTSKIQYNSVKSLGGIEESSKRKSIYLTLIILGLLYKHWVTVMVVTVFHTLKMQGMIVIFSRLFYSLSLKLRNSKSARIIQCSVNVVLSTTVVPFLFL